MHSRTGLHTVGSMLRRMLRPWLLAPVALVLSACIHARAPIADELAPLDARAARERAQLRYIGAFGELADTPTQAIERQREAARVALRLGNRDEAAALAREQLDMGRGLALVAQLLDDPRLEREAAATLDDAAVFAIDLGDELLDARLVLEAAQFLRKPSSRRKPIERALTFARDVDLSYGYERLWSSFERSPAQLAALQRLRWRGHPSAGLPVRASRLAPDELADLGAEATDLIRYEIDRAAREDRLDDLAIWTDAMLEADPLDLTARMIAVVLAAVQRRELVRDDLLLPDLAPSGGADPLGSHARQLLRQREAPNSRALTLARASMMILDGTFGDAAELIEQLEPGGSEDEQALAEQIAVLARLESGSEDGRRAFARWSKRNHADRSPWVQELLGFYAVERAPASYQALAREAAQARVLDHHGRELPWTDFEALEHTALDPDVRKPAREQALAAVSAHSPQRGAMLAVCRERKLSGDDCRDLVGELSKLEHASPEYLSGLDALGRSANARAEWFAAIPWLDSEQMGPALARSSAYEGTRLAATTDFQTAAVFAELAANRPDLARARLEAHHSLLRPETLAVAHMALLDVEQGLVEPEQLGQLLLELPSADVEAAWMSARWLPGDPSMVGELFPGRSRLATFARGLALARMGAWRSGAAELLLTLEMLDPIRRSAGEGREQGSTTAGAEWMQIIVAGRLALAAELADEATLRDAAVDRLTQLHPSSFVIPYIGARAAERDGRTSEAHRLYMAALLRRPRAEVALDGLLRTLPLAQRSAERVRDALLLFPDAGVHWQAGELLDMLADDEIDGPMLAALWLARDDGDAALALGEIAARWRTTGQAGLERLLELLEQAERPDRVFPIAARTLAWLGALPADVRVQRRDLELWLTLLLGRERELEALAHARPLAQGLPEPSWPTHASLLLAEARRAGALDDARMWELVRREMWGEAASSPLSLDQLIASAEPAPAPATPPADPSLAQLECMHRLQREDFDYAAAHCVPLWQQLGGSRFLAIDFAYLALNQPELLRAGGLEPSAVFEVASGLPDLRDEPVWLLNHSLWLSSQGEHQRGATIRVDQLALDGGVGAAVDVLELGQASYRGPLLRQQIVDNFDPQDRRRWSVASGLALRSVDLLAAELYARRVIAWLPARDDEAPPELTARAPQVLAATRLEGETSDADLRSMALYSLHMVALMRDDLAAERIDEPALRALMDAHADSLGLGVLEPLARKHPDSHVAKLLLLGAYREASLRAQAIELARELVALHGSNPLVVAEALPLLTSSEDLEHARAVLIAARAQRPDHPWLQDDALPAVLTGARDRLPAWAREPERFDAQLAAVDERALLELAPVRRFHTRVAAEAFFAASAQPRRDSQLGVSEPIPASAEPADDDQAEGTKDPDALFAGERVQFIVREPRASRCEGMDCAEPLLSEWTGRGYSLLWSRELELPAGHAIEFLVSDGDSVIDNLLIPTGGNLFVLIAGTTPEDLPAFVPQLALLRRSFRPLDFSLDAFAAETLRTAGAALPSDDLRLRGRLDLAALTEGAAQPTPRCPVSEELGSLEPTSRGELLLDLLLITRTPLERASLLACTDPSAPEAARLALPALLDEQTRAHEFGRAATQAHPDRVVTDSKRILYTRREAASSDPLLTSDVDRPPFGLLQVIAALPHQHARPLIEDMLGRSDDRLRALALLATGSIDYFDAPKLDKADEALALTPPERLRSALAGSSTSEAILALDSLASLPSAANLDALRSRADALIDSGASDHGGRSLALALAWTIAQRLDSKDRKRLLGLAKAIEQNPSDDRASEAEATRERIEGIVEDFDAGRKLLGARILPSDDETPTRWARELRTKPAPHSREQLERASLAELLPGDAWTYVRVDDTGLFAASLENLLRRLAPSSAADAYLVRSLIQDVLLQGFAQLGEQGGLDLSAGIECASPKGSPSFVCSAKVRDRETLMTLLASRELGDDTGLAIPLSLVTEFAALPLTLAAAPIMLHGFVALEVEQLDPTRAPEIAAERLRTRRIIAGHELDYYATIELREDSAVVDSEHYLLVGDRLLAFGGAHIAELVLREPAKGQQPLAAAPAFQRASAGWKEGMALHAVDLADTFGLAEVALELVFTGEGLEFSAQAKGEGLETRDFAHLDALLPERPVTRLATVIEADEREELLEELDFDDCTTPADVEPPTDRSEAAAAIIESSPPRCGLTPTDKLPPVSLIRAAPALIFGWYAEPEDGLWSRWVLVLPLDASLRKAMKQLGLPSLSPERAAEHQGLHWLERDGALVIANDAELAGQAAARPIPAKLEPGQPRPFVLGSMDGQRAARIVRSLATRYQADRRGDFLRVVATMVGLVGEVELTGAWTEGDRGQLRATIDLNLAESEEELALIDRWLADPEVGNAAKLPRKLSSADTEQPLEYLIRVDDPESFARTTITDNPRISVEVVDHERVRVRVLPSRRLPADRPAQPLNKDQRTRMLGSDAQIRADAEAIHEVADTLMREGDPAQTVAAVVDWVHNRIRYEITPTSLDALTVLERGKGDCTEFALLTVTLLRAAGVPAELREGMAAGGNELVAHAWVAWHDGTRWHEIDPTAGTTHVSAGHLEVAVIDVLALLSLGRFEILEVAVLKP